MKIVEGDILSLESGILVHGCNCLGVMGAGIARLIKDKWPGVYKAYRQVHEKQGLYLGDVIAVGRPEWAQPHPGVNRSIHMHFTAPELPPSLVVANAMTQYGVRQEDGERVVDYDALSAAFARIKLMARDTELEVHFPLIGCGLAGGRWSEVAERIDQALGPDVSKTLWVLPGTDIAKL